MTMNDLEYIEIFNTYSPGIESYLRRLVGQDEAEDLTQEVFFRVSSRIGEFRGESKLSTWIYRIATNLAHDRLKSAAFRMKSKEDVDIDELDPAAHVQSPATAISTETQVIKDEMGACIREHIALLPENLRIPFILSEYHDMKNNEIAEILQISLANAKIRLHRAREMMKTILEQNCDFYKDDNANLACDRKKCGPSESCS